MLNNRRCFSQVMPMKKEQGIAWNKKWQLKNNVIGNGQLFFESFDTTPEIIDKMKRSPDSSTPNEFDNLAVKPIFDRSWCKCNNYATDLVFSVLTMSVTYKLKSELWHKEIKSCYSSFYSCSVGFIHSLMRLMYGQLFVFKSPRCKSYKKFDKKIWTWNLAQNKS